MRDSDDSAATCKQITDELVLKCTGLKDNSTKAHFKLVRRHCRELGQTVLPKCPRDVYKRVVALESDRVAERMNDPIVIQTDKLIALIVKGLRDGIERHQYPHVIFCLNYLIGLRPNDLNRGHIRIGGGNAQSSALPLRMGETRNTTQQAQQAQQAQQVCPGDHIVVSSSGEDGELNQICGTLLNLNPSKFISGKRVVLVYSTVFICDVVDCELVGKGIDFVQNADKASISCADRVPQYTENMPLGASSGQEWGNARKGIMKAMIARLDLNSCTTEWANHKFGISKQLGRGFAASCVEQDRFELEPGLAPLKNDELL